MQMVKTTHVVQDEVRIVSSYIIYNLHDEGKVNELSKVFWAGVIMILWVGERFRHAFPNATL